MSFCHSTSILIIFNSSIILRYSLSSLYFLNRTSFSSSPLVLLHARILQSNSSCRLHDLVSCPPSPLSASFGSIVRAPGEPFLSMQLAASLLSSFQHLRSRHVGISSKGSLESSVFLDSARLLSPFCKLLLLSNTQDDSNFHIEMRRYEIKNQQRYLTQ